MELPMHMPEEQQLGICEAIEREIRSQEPLHPDPSVPSSYHRSFDPMINPDFPSIFNFPGRRDYPYVVTIGPYHRTGPRYQLIITEAKKIRIVNFLTDHHQLNINEFLRWALTNEGRVRSCYQEGSLLHINLNNRNCVQMLLLDGCLLLFVIFLLRPSAQIDGSLANMAIDERFNNEFLDISTDISFNRKQLKLELLTLDSQIPFFVVEQLYEQLQTSLFEGVNAGSIKELALSCFDDIHPICNYDMNHPSFPERVHHLLHLFHWSRSPTGRYNVEVNDVLTNQLAKSHLPSATELSESAIFYRKQPQGTSLDLSFHREMFGMYGKMMIPSLYISDQSELIFRNLIAFEQKHLRCGLSVTALCISMAGLLQSETDAKLLRKNRILAPTNKTNQEIVNFFKELSGQYDKTIITRDLLELCKDVRTQHKSSRQGRFIGEVMLKYFSSPLITISVIVGVIIFIATVGNSIHSAYRTYHPAVQR